MTNKNASAVSSPPVFAPSITVIYFLIIPSEAFSINPLFYCVRVHTHMCVQEGSCLLSVFICDCPRELNRVKTLRACRATKSALFRH